PLAPPTPPHPNTPDTNSSVAMPVRTRILYLPPFLETTSVPPPEQPAPLCQSLLRDVFDRRAFLHIRMLTVGRRRGDVGQRCEPGRDRVEQRLHALEQHH